MNIKNTKFLRNKNHLQCYTQLNQFTAKPEIKRPHVNKKTISESNLRNNTFIKEQSINEIVIVVEK